MERDQTIWPRGLRNEQPMKRYCLKLKPQSAFGVPIKGDTIFGQLCWAVANRHGETHLQELLSEYFTHPFAVLSDGFPCGYLPRPSLPVRYFDIPENEDRKIAKAKSWISQNNLKKPVAKWLDGAKSDSDLIGTHSEQPHNTINRLTGTTGEGMFAPYSQSQTWHQTKKENGVVETMEFNVYMLLDEDRLSLSDAKTLISDIGAFGYGRDASIGMGKFECIDCREWKFPAPEATNACLTLAPCAPQGLGLDKKRSYYKLFTRFGRHGDLGVHKKHGPFKAPVLLADTAAVFSPVPAQAYIGQALGAEKQKLSKAIPETVHQGYAPYIPICLPEQDQGDA